MAGLTRFFNSREDNETRRYWFHRWPARPALQSNSSRVNADVIAQFSIPSKPAATLAGLGSYAYRHSGRPCSLWIMPFVPRSAAISPWGGFRDATPDILASDQAHESEQE